MGAGRILIIIVATLTIHFSACAEAFSQDDISDLNAKFKNDLKKRTETPQWKNLEQKVAVALGLSQEAAKKANVGAQQRIINAQLETPRETAKYLSDLAFNRASGTDGASAIIIEITTNPTAVAQARQLVSPEAQAKVNSLFDSPQLRRLNSSALRANVPAPGARPEAAPTGSGEAAAPRTSPNLAPSGTGNSAAPQTPGNASPRAPPEQKVAAPAGTGGAASPRAQPEQKMAAAAPSKRPAVPPGYEPVKGGSIGCPVKN